MKKKYINIQKHWQTIKPIAESKEAKQIWKRDLKKYHTAFRVFGPDLKMDLFNEEWFQRINNFSWYINNDKPSDFDAADWRDLVGPHPEFWDYVVLGCCHFLVNFNLFLAQKAFPKNKWRIVTSEEHSCVWDGKNLLFDMNFFALIPNIRKHPFYDSLDYSVKILPFGKELELGISDENVRVLDTYDRGEISFKEFHFHFFKTNYVPSFF